VLTETTALRVHSYFDAVCVSGAMGVAKPSPSAFQRVEMVFRPIACNELMHIGDSVD
jgi:FMN phosphatase YigB (HAD superfamily)